MKAISYNYYAVQADLTKSKPYYMQFHTQQILHLECLIPVTLNGFICDCQRAGIELQFKEEIAQKLL